MATIALPAAAAQAAGRAASAASRRRLALLPTAIVVLVVYLGCMLWTVRLSFTSSQLLPMLDFVGLAAIRAPVRQRALPGLGREHRHLRRAVSSPAPGPRLPAGGVHRPAGPRRERLPHHLPLSLRDVASSSPASSGSGSSTRRFGLQKLVRDLGFESFTFDWIVNQQMVIYTLVIAGLWHASGLVMAILLAGLRGVDDDLWKAARVDGIPTWRVYLSIVLPMLGPMVVTVDRAARRSQVVEALRPRRRDDPRRPGHRLRGAGQVRHGPPVRAQQYRARHGRPPP